MQYTFGHLMYLFVFGSGNLLHILLIYYFLLQNGQKQRVMSISEGAVLVLNVTA